MSDNKKESWKKTSTELGHAFRDLGKALIKTGKMGVDTAVEWAQKDDAAPEAADAATAYTPQNLANERSVSEEIQQLAQLRDQGLITEEEFTAKKKQILGI